MSKLAGVQVGANHPVRIMGIINVSPESFYKKSIKSGMQIRQAAQQMEQDGADFVDIGGMSTAPYLRTVISQKQEQARIVDAVKHVCAACNLPISVDTCRATVAEAALQNGAEILNDISGLKYDRQMPEVVSKFAPYLVLCAYSNTKQKGDLVVRTRFLLKQSIKIAQSAGVKSNHIVLDPAVGFFRRTGKNPFYTKIASNWFQRDIQTIKNLSKLKMNFPLLVSISNKSFIGKITGKDEPQLRIYGSVAAEAIAVLNGADVIRTHNVAESKDAIAVAQAFAKKFKKGL